jgi:hypothetical protein
MARIRTMRLVILAAVLMAGSAAGHTRAAAQEMRVTVTVYFGGQARATHEREVALPAGANVMDAVRKAARVETNAAGTFVQSIEGVANSDERKEYWLYFVNGEPAHVGATETRLKNGDRVLWFLRRASSTTH